jgi:hypothetical protein
VKGKKEKLPSNGGQLLWVKEVCSGCKKLLLSQLHLQYNEHLVVLLGKVGGKTVKIA